VGISECPQDRVGFKALPDPPDSDVIGASATSAVPAFSSGLCSARQGGEALGGRIRTASTPVDGVNEAGEVPGPPGTTHLEALQTRIQAVVLEA